MVDISIVNGIINQLITGGAPPCMYSPVITSGKGQSRRSGGFRTKKSSKTAGFLQMFDDWTGI